MVKGTITFKGANLATSTMRFEGVSSQIVLSGLKTSLEAFSDCDIPRTAYSESSLYSVVGAGNTDLKAIITCQDQIGHVHKWALPGFNGTPVVDNEGERVSDANMVTILAALSTATTLTLSPLRSPIIQTS